VTGPTGPTGSGGAGSNSGGLPAFLPSGGKEQGAFSATINVSAGGLQEQSEASISYAVPLKEAPKLHYVPESQVEAPKSPCLGEPNAPSAEPGFLCVYRSGGFGSLESQDKNAKFFNFYDPKGNEGEPGGKTGELVAFRTTPFNEEEGGTIPAAATLDAQGAWATTAK